MCHAIDYRDLGYVEGFKLTAWIEPDTDTAIHEFDVYTPAQVAAWQRMEWGFVVLHVDAERWGTLFGEAYVQGVPYGLHEYAKRPEVRFEFPTHWLTDLPDMAVKAAKHRLETVVDGLGLTAPAPV